MSKEKAVFKFNADLGRQGTLEGLFIANKKHVDWLVSSGLDVYFGEVLGKHSEIYGTIDTHMITMISDDEDIVKVLEDNDIAVGINPLDYGLLDTEEVLGELYEDDLTAIEVYNLIHNIKK